MITVTDVPITTGITGDEKTTRDVDTVTFQCELTSTGDVAILANFIDDTGKAMITFRALDAVTADFVISSESITNPNTIFLREAEKQLKAFLLAANPTATFTIT